MSPASCVATCISASSCMSFGSSLNLSKLGMSATPELLSQAVQRIGHTSQVRHRIACPGPPIVQDGGIASTVRREPIGTAGEQFLGVSEELGGRDRVGHVGTPVVVGGWQSYR